MDQLTTSDRELLLSQVNRLADQVLGGLPEGAETPRAPQWQQQWRDSAWQAGVLPQGADPDELMLWSPGLEEFSLEALRAIAMRDAGAALLLHRETSAWLPLRQSGRCTSLAATGRCPVLALHGAAGPGRAALATWLHDREPSAEDREEMETNLGARATRLVFAGTWDMTLLPVWQEGRLDWWQLPRNAPEITPVSAHAFETLEVTSVVPAAGEPLAPVEPTELTALLLQEYLALLAIGAGLVDRALQRAGDHAGQRRQGGRLIRDWPAVRELLADIRQTGDALDDALGRYPAPGPGSLARTLRRYLHLSGEICRACNQCMQVFGGIGYMRELAPERLVREANALRRMAGSPVLLTQFAACLEDD